MKKFGFTLAEVLITMTIIGVVAALTTPALFNNAHNAHVGPTLAKIKATIENANQQLMQDEEVGNLHTLFADIIAQQANGNNDDLNNDIAMRYIELLSNYMRIEIGDEHPEFKTYTGGQTGAISINTAGELPGGGTSLIYLLPSAVKRLARNTNIDTVEGAKLGFRFLAAAPGNAAQNGVPLPMQLPQNNFGIVIVDINGNANPNRFGKDIFAFIFRNDGQLLPYGEQDNNNNWQTRCPTNGPVDSNPAAGLSCTATIFNNGLRVTYDE